MRNFRPICVLIFMRVLVLPEITNQIHVPSSNSSSDLNTYQYHSLFVSHESRITVILNQ